MNNKSLLHSDHFCHYYVTYPALLHIQSTNISVEHNLYFVIEPTVTCLGIFKSIRHQAAQESEEGVMYKT